MYVLLEKTRKNGKPALLIEHLCGHQYVVYAWAFAGSGSVCKACHEKTHYMDNVSTSTLEYIKIVDDESLLLELEKKSSQLVQFREMRACALTDDGRAFVDAIIKECSDKIKGLNYRLRKRESHETHAGRNSGDTARLKTTSR